MAYLDHCDSLTGWTTLNGTLTIDTSTKTEGTGSLKLTSSGNYGYVKHAFSPNTMTSISFDVYIADYTKINEFWVFIETSSDGSSMFYYDLNPSSNGWTSYNYNIADLIEDGTPNWETVDRWGFYIDCSSNTYVNIDNVQYVEPSSNIDITLPSTINNTVEALTSTITFLATINANTISNTVEVLTPNIFLEIPVIVSLNTIDVSLDEINPSISYSNNVFNVYSDVSVETNNPSLIANSAANLSIIEVIVSSNLPSINISTTSVDWLTPKVNWTASDYYNYYDLNRVENNTLFLKETIDTFMTIDALETVVLNRTNLNIEFASSLNRIERNINKLKFQTPLSWTEPKTNWTAFDAFDYNDANRLENNLLYLYRMVIAIISPFKYCGSPQSVCGNSLHML